MNEKLKRIIDQFKDSDYEIKFVNFWTEIGIVDSCLFNSYSEAAKDQHDYVKIIPVIVERNR